MIIKSILDTDLYKFTTSYAYIKLFPSAVGTFRFTDRDETVYSEEFIDRLKQEISLLAEVKLTTQEREAMIANCRFVPCVYWEWLSAFRFDPARITLGLDANGHLHLEVTDLLYKATLYEVPLLALISEVRNRYHHHAVDSSKMIQQLNTKIALSNSNQLTFSEFGTRRRFSYDVQETVIAHLKQEATYCNGTSNCYLALKYDLKMMGTHPHEWFMFHGAQFGYKHANYMALENWVNVYDGDLGIALSDTYTTDLFLSNLSRKQAKLFDGVRCDSGNEYAFIDKLIARYNGFGIDATTKIIIFSNGLDFKKALDIQNYCRGKIRCGFGIGTNLTNDTGFKPSNIVMKLSQCKMNANQEWKECIKLSDDNGKHTGTLENIEACLHELKQMNLWKE